MPSISHDGPIDVIRNNPDLTVDLVHRFTRLPVLAHRGRLRVELGSTDASNVVPDEFKADMVTVIRDEATNDPLLVVIIEPQGRADQAKQFSWPAYVANLRAAHKCRSAVLIVICWDVIEADKCRKDISMGHPGFTLRPIVIGPNDGLELAEAGPWETVLAGSMGAVDLATDAGRRAILDAIRDTRSDVPVTRTLSAIILGVAPNEAARAALEALMQTKEYKNDFFDRAEAQGEAKALVIVLKSRDMHLTAEQLDQVMSCTDSEKLELWVGRAAAATSVDDVFKD
jgi:hypothetical protein